MPMQTNSNPLRFEGMGRSGRLIRNGVDRDGSVRVESNEAVANQMTARETTARKTTSREMNMPDEQPGLETRDPVVRASHMIELLAIFVFGVGLSQFIYLDARGLPLTELGAPGFDSFYHTKMAAMIPEVGLVSDFPWLRYVYFSQHHNGFISHHYGFHMLLMPFVKVSHWLTGDYLIGGRFAISVFFGASLVMLQALLILGRVPWRWMWLIAFLLLPPEFFGRHAYIRAISPSLMFMLAIVYLMFKERAVFAGVAIAAYVHLYLGSVVYAPMIVALYALANVIAPTGERRFPWRVVMWTTFGWLVGLRTYPYFSGALEFLQMQIFGTGLDPDISVGMEWNSYGNVWHFAARSCGPILTIWTVALVLRLRLGKRLNAQELTLVLIQFLFLVLTLKAKRFIEYWPPFCMLSAAFMVAPIIRPLADWFDPARLRTRTMRAAVMQLAMAMALLCVTIVIARRIDFDALMPLFRERQFWLVAGGLMIAAPLVRALGIRQNVTGGTLSIIQPLILVGVLVGGLGWAISRITTSSDIAPQLSLGVGGWLLAGCAFVAICVWSATRPRVARDDVGLSRRGLGGVTVLMFGGAIMISTVLIAGESVLARQRDVYCGYDLHTLNDAMEYLKSVSDEGDVVFTDDWDVFPAYFYFNSYNNYIVGLDPKFTHWRDPQLWERYVKLTRAQVPRTFKATWTGQDGRKMQRTVHVELSDIRDYFDARFIMVDNDHKAMARMLAKATDFAKLIYPQTQYDKCKDAQYLIFKVIDAEGGIDTVAAKKTSRTVGAQGVAYLDELKPISVEQGWGEIHFNRSVSDKPLHLSTGFFERGIGTHAPSTIVYSIPRGAEMFESSVGVSRSSDGPGTIVVSVLVDGVEVYTSPVLTRDGPPAHVRVEIGDVNELTLRANPTEDGNRWDHVDWAEPRFTGSFSGHDDPKPSQIRDRRSGISKIEE
jgi:NPCBM/NEW2 domain